MQTSESANKQTVQKKNGMTGKLRQTQWRCKMCQNKLFEVLDDDGDEYHSHWQVEGKSFGIDKIVGFKAGWQNSTDQ